MNKIVHKLISFVNPTPAVGGLVIADSSIRFVREEGGGTRPFSLRLPQGIVVGGVIKDHTLLVAALKGIKEELGEGGRPTHVILVVPQEIIFTEMVTIPAVGEMELDETAKLNLELASPIKSEEAYFGYEVIGEGGGNKKVLGAFVRKTIIDEFTAACREAGFLPTSVEFPALALLRFLSAKKATNEEVATLLISIVDDGIMYTVTKKGKAYFTRFDEWPSLAKEGDLFEVVVKTIRKIKIFHTNRWGEEIGTISVLGPALADDLLAHLKQTEALSVERLLTIDGPDSYLIAVGAGAALRGRIPPSQDSILTLAPQKAREEYYQNLLLTFVGHWRNIIVATLVCITVVFGVSDIVLARLATTLTERLASTSPAPLTEEITKLQEEAGAFNALLGRLSYARERAPRWSVFMLDIDTIAKNTGTTINRLLVSNAEVVQIIGKSGSERAVVDFKNAITKHPQAKDVVVPVEGVKPSPDGTFSFALSFRLINVSF